MPPETARRARAPLRGSRHAAHRAGSLASRPAMRASRKNRRPARRRPAPGLGQNGRWQQEYSMAGPLQGLKVVEMGTLIAGPFCARLMAEFGAEVIKVETPGE